MAVMEAFGSVVGGAAALRRRRLPRPDVTAAFSGSAFSAGCAFLAAVAQGRPALEALWQFAQLGNGQFSHDDRCFFPTNVVLGPVADHIGLLHRAKRKVIRGCEGEAETTLFLVEGTVAAVVCGGACACNG